MNVFPWADVVAHANEKIAQGMTVFQQWNCASCGTKQTMPDANQFYALGICEECGWITDIQTRGMSFMTVVAISEKAKKELPEIFAAMLKQE